MKIRFPKILYSKLFLIGILILLLGLIALELQQWKARQAIKIEINYLIDEQKALEQKNIDLQQSLQYFSSDSYKEKLAREQFGLQKEGEIVINFPKLAEQASTTEPVQIKSNNFEKWWEYLFLKNHN